MTIDDAPADVAAAAALGSHSNGSITPANGNAAVMTSSTTHEAHTSFPGRWTGVWLQFDGETGVLLDRSQIDLWVGQSGRNFSRLCVRKHQSGQSERTFIQGQLTQYDRATRAFVAVAHDKNFKWTTEFQTERLSTTRLVHKDESKAKDVRVHGIVSFPQIDRKSVVRQIFLGNKLTIENGKEVRLGDVEYMPCDPDPKYCTNPDHHKNFPNGFSYD